MNKNYDKLQAESSERIQSLERQLAICQDELMSVTKRLDRSTACIEKMWQRNDDRKGERS